MIKSLIPQFIKIRYTTAFGLFPRMCLLFFSFFFFCQFKHCRATPSWFAASNHVYLKLPTPSFLIHAGANLLSMCSSLFPNHLPLLLFTSIYHLPLSETAAKALIQQQRYARVILRTFCRVNMHPALTPQCTFNHSSYGITLNRRIPSLPLY